MLSPSLAATLRDITKHRKVSDKVDSILDSHHPTVPISQRFEFCKSLLDIILQNPASPAAIYFDTAISCLRSLAPSLRGDNASMTDVIARVEKYTVKFALLVNESEHPTVSNVAFRELETTLRLLFEPRTSLPSTCLTKSFRRRPKSYAQSKHLLDHKENSDPQARSSSSKSRRASGRLQPVEVSNILDRMLFIGASEFPSHALLPGKDSSLTSRLIAGALTIRLTSTLLDAVLGERIYLFKAIALPWIRHLQSFPEPSNHEFTSCFTDKICHFLQDAIAKESCGLVTTRALALSLSLQNLSLACFTHNLHKAALKLIATDKLGLMQQEILDVVVSVYEDGLQFVLTFPRNDPDWGSEELSIWLDHVLHVWIRINAKSLPEVFSNRITALRKNNADPELIKCFEIQIDLFKIGAYARKTCYRRNFDNEKSLELVWADVERQICRVDAPDFFTVRDRWASNHNPVAKGTSVETVFVFHRFLHVIEPLRALLLGHGQSSLSDLVSENEILLRRHISTTLSGLQLLANPQFSNWAIDEGSKKRLIVHLNRIAGGALEASKELLKLYWAQREPDMFCNVITCVASILKYQSEWCKEYVLEWWVWFLNWLKPFFENARKSAEVSQPSEREYDEGSLLTLLQHCDIIIEAHCKNLNVLDGRLALLKTLRKLYVSRSDWQLAFDISSKIFIAEYSAMSSSKVPQLESANFFVQDLIRCVTDPLDERDSFNTHLENSIFIVIPYSYILGLLMEYQCYTRSSCSSFRSRESYLEILYGLQRSRYLLFKHMASKNDCILLQMHRLWITFIFDGGEIWNTQEGRKLQQMLRDEYDLTCDGHLETSSFGFDEGTSSCSNMHLQLLAVVADIWRFTEEANFDELGDLFDELEEIKATMSITSHNREFLLLTAEILDWASFSLALRDYDLHALRARTFAEECRVASQIPRTDNPFLRDLCVRVASSVLYSWYLDVRGQNEWSPELREVKLQLTEWNFNSAAGIMDRVETELPPYETALAHEFGCGNITSALLHSHKALKSIVRRMANSKDELNFGERKFNIGGAIINIDADIRIEAGQELMRELLELINTLFQYARLYFEAESINLGQYYMERCYALASECLPEGNYTLASVLAAYQAKVSAGNPVGFLKETVGAFGETYVIELGRNVVSEHEMWSNLTTCRYRHDKIASIEDVIRACDICEKAVKAKRPQSEDWAKRAGTELGVLKAIALSSAGETDKAVKMMNPLLKRFPAIRANIRVFAHYHLARSMWKLHQLNEAKRKTSRKRATRSRPRTGSTNAAKDVDQAIDLTLQQLTADFNVPWICRKVYGLQSLKIKASSDQDCSADISLIARKIGLSFNVRWRFLMKTKLEQSLTQGMTSEISRWQLLETLFQDFSIGELDKLTRLLEESKCIVVGIDIDDTQEHLIMWRICRNGTFLEKKQIPSDGPTSVRGILERINNVVSVKRDVPETREKLTNKEKSEWWAHRFRLDQELETIVSEVESEWIADIEYMLDPDLNEEACSDVNDGDLEQIVLLVDTKLERIPWESVGVLRERVISVTRAPSLAFLEHYLRTPVEEIDQEDMFYLINPTGEFKKTETRFREITQAQAGWSGFCGACTRENVNNGYNGQRMYMYCGHGTGVAFMSPRRFEKAEDAPVTLLMGCSSARPENLGVEDEESNGAAVDLLIRGAPAVVGALWDVSDGEIDRFTLSLLELWTGAGLKGEDSNYVSLAEAVARSRSACRTPYLVGAACIVIGAPNIRVRSSSK